MPDTRVLTRGRAPDPMGKARVTLMIERGANLCCDVAPNSVWVCTRLDGHGDRHAASNGYDIVAVWDR